MKLEILVLVLVLTATSYGCITVERVERVETVTELKQGEVPKELVLQSVSLRAVVGPTEAKILRGIVHVKIEQLPPETGKVTVLLSPQGMKADADPMQEKNVIYEVVDPGTDEVFLDTEKIPNGVYNLAVKATKDFPTDENSWIDLVRTQVIVQN